jgi:four helix bundle protein
MSSFRKLIVYQKAFALAMEIFHVTKSFPPEEKFDLSLQIRKSSRSVCASIGEAYRKRRYVAHFVSKCTDADMENTETQVWLDFSLSRNYISKQKFEDYNSKSEEVGKMLNELINHPEKFQ